MLYNIVLSLLLGYHGWRSEAWSYCPFTCQIVDPLPSYTLLRFPSLSQNAQGCDEIRGRERHSTGGKHFAWSLVITLGICFSSIFLLSRGFCFHFQLIALYNCKHLDHCACLSLTHTNSYCYLLNEKENLCMYIMGKQNTQSVSFIH